MTRTRVVTSRRADRDIAAAIQHYATEAGVAVAVATDFTGPLEARLIAIARHPENGSSRFALETAIPDLRGLAVRSYPSVVLYTTGRQTARVVRVLHTSREVPTDLGEGQ